MSKLRHPSVVVTALTAVCLVGGMLAGAGPWVWALWAVWAVLAVLAVRQAAGA